MLITKKIPWKQDPLRVFYNKFLDLAAIDAWILTQRDSKEFSLSIGWRIGGLSRANLLASIQEKKEITYERQIYRFWISNLHFNIPKRYTVDKSSLILSKRSINSLNPVHGWTRSRKEILKGPILVSVHALPRKSKYPLTIPYHERKETIYLSFKRKRTSLESSRIRHESTLSFSSTYWEGIQSTVRYYALCRIRRDALAYGHAPPPLLLLFPSVNGAKILAWKENGGRGGYRGSWWMLGILYIV